MQRSPGTSRRGWLVLAGIVALLCVGASGQQRGQYLLGTNGFNSGIQPDPGFTYANLSTFFDAVRLKGPNGGPIPVNGSFNLYVNQSFFIYVTNLKILGGHLGVLYDLPIVNGSITELTIGLAGGGAGVGDMYFEPFDLGWHLKRADMKVAYGFIAPTGRYTAGATDNVGSGYWGSQFQFAATIYLTANKGTTFSVYNNYEIHGNKKGFDLTPGQTYSLEYGLAQVLPLDPEKHKLLQFGAVGYLQTQTTDNSGSDVNPALAGVRYHVFSLGPEVDFLMPERKLGLLFRYEPEFGAQARTEGRTIVFGGNFTF